MPERASEREREPCCERQCKTRALTGFERRQGSGLLSLVEPPRVCVEKLKGSRVGRLPESPRLLRELAQNFRKASNARGGDLGDTGVFRFLDAATSCTQVSYRSGCRKLEVGGPNTAAYLLSIHMKKQCRMYRRERSEPYLRESFNMGIARES